MPTFEPSAIATLAETHGAFLEKRRMVLWIRLPSIPTSLAKWIRYAN